MTIEEQQKKVQDLQTILAYNQIVMANHLSQIIVGDKALDLGQQEMELDVSRLVANMNMRLRRTGR